METRVRLYNRLLWEAEALSQKADEPTSPDRVEDLEDRAYRSVTPPPSVVYKAQVKAADQIQAIADARNPKLIQAWQLLQPIKNDPLFYNLYKFADRRVYLGTNTI